MDARDVQRGRAHQRPLLARIIGRERSRSALDASASRIVRPVYDMNTSSSVGRAIRIDLVGVRSSARRRGANSSAPATWKATSPSDSFASILSGPVRAQKAERLSRCDAEAHPPHGLDLAESLHQVPNRHDRLRMPADFSDVSFDAGRRHGYCEGACSGCAASFTVTATRPDPRSTVSLSCSPG